MSVLITISHSVRDSNKIPVYSIPIDDPLLFPQNLLKVSTIAGQ